MRAPHDPYLLPKLLMGARVGVARNSCMLLDLQWDIWAVYDLFLASLRQVSI